MHGWTASSEGRKPRRSPQTFVLVSGSRSADAAAFDAAARALAAKSSSAAAAAPIAADSGGPASPPPPPQPQVFAAAQWIVKPSCLNRGRGIQVFPDAAGVLAHIGAAERGTEWVVQRYIANPMLVRNRKFDIRQLVLFTPQGQVLLLAFAERAHHRAHSTPHLE